MSLEVIARNTRAEIADMDTRQKIGVGLAAAMTAVRVGAVYSLAKKPSDEAWNMKDLAVASLIPISDFLDGHIARHMNAQTTAGAYADQMLDKIAMGVLEAKQVSRGQLNASDALLRIGRDIHVSRVRSEVAKASNGNVSIAANNRGKNSTAARMGADFISMTPFAQRYPRTASTLSHIATAMVVKSGEYNTEQYTKASREYLDQHAA